MPDFLPRPDAELLSWTRNFDLRINSDPEGYGFSPQTVAEYHQLFLAFESAYRLANEPGTRTKPSITAKDTIRDSLTTSTRALAGRVCASGRVSDTLRIEAGLRVRATRHRRIGPPQSAPLLAIIGVTGKTVKLQLRHADAPWRVAKARGIDGAGILIFVGEKPPASHKPWGRPILTTRTTAAIDFPADLPPGTRVWMTAYWYNPTGQTGPVASPIFTWLGAGGRIGDGLKMAA